MSHSAGDAVNINPHQPARVLFAGGGNHTSHVAGGSPFGEVPHLRYDISFDKVRKFIFMLYIYVKYKLYML